jgi:hypothetical protein
MLSPPMSFIRPAALAIVTLIAIATSGGCFDRDPYSLLSRHAPQKIPAIKEAVDHHDESAIPELVHDLDSDDSAVRFYAIEGLKRLTGQDFEYHYYMDAADRKPSVMKWRQWLHDQEKGSTTQRS